MLRVLQRISTIIREEMDAAGAQELLLPMLQPAELWQESGRWEHYGKELFRLKNRHGREEALAPTAEELITAVARSEVGSYRQLPVNLYQISQKYRDEVRPRFGLLRGREFIMKDAYSFHASTACLEAEYERMAAAYHRIFERCGLKTLMVRSDSGSIGGACSHEFMLLTGTEEGAQQSGENDVVFSPSYAANVEKAESLFTFEEEGVDGTICPALAALPVGQPVATPHTHTIEALSQQLGCEPHHILKTLLYRANEGANGDVWVAVLMRGDYEVEDTKLKQAVEALPAWPAETPLHTLRLATEAEFQQTFGATKGFVGFYRHLCLGEALPTLFPALTQPLHVLADCTVAPDKLKGFVVASCGEEGVHYAPASYYEGLMLSVADVRRVKAGDRNRYNPQETLAMTRGIEVGNIFQLGTKYSQAMGATFAAEDGTQQPFVMGCYGIGVTRLAAAIVERHHSANGPLWPPSVAPWQVAVVVANVKDDTQMALAETLYAQLQAVLPNQVLLDDRDERAGVKFADAELLGVPLRVTVGKLAAEGKVEVKWHHQPKEGATVWAAAELPAATPTLLTQWNPLEG
jgi:prolyl-tRNA synthetase